MRLTNRRATLLEVVIMITTEGNQLVVHEMPMRNRYRRLLGL